VEESLPKISDECEHRLDLGPLGCAVKNNMLKAWGEDFILEEQVLEIDSSFFSTEPILK